MLYSRLCFNMLIVFKNLSHQNTNLFKKFSFKISPTSVIIRTAEKKRRRKLEKPRMENKEEKFFYP